MAIVTAEERAVIPESEDHEDFFEIIDGQRVELPPMGAHEVWLASQIFSRIDHWARPQDLGQAVMEMLFDLRPALNRSRRPDLAFVSFGRWAKDRRVPRKNAWGVIPDLAIEVISPNDLAEKILTRILEYFRAGVRRVWVVYPEQAIVYDYESPTVIHVLGRADDLDGGAVLPGFRLPLADLFDEEEPESGTEPGATANPTT